MHGQQNIKKNITKTLFLESRVLYTQAVTNIA